MTKGIVLRELNKLKYLMCGIANTPFSIFVKVLVLVTMNMRYEKIAFNMKLKKHPYLLTREIIYDAINQFKAFMEISFIESENKSIKNFKETKLQKKHLRLWQEIWDRHSKKEFKEFVNLKKNRLLINKLKQYIKDKNCVDLGCGNGSFTFALIELGASSVTGIDFGEKSIRYANMFARERKIKNRAHFYVADVLNNKLPDSRFDFAVSNGVFHHLAADKVPFVISEVARVLKKGGWFWYYVDGKNAISMDLFDASVEILRGIDTSFIENILKSMNLKRNKMVHLMDSLNATYIHSTYSEVTGLLKRNGFANFKRLKGGTLTDFDLDRIKADPFGKEKFGEGDLRILSQLIKK